MICNNIVAINCKRWKLWNPGTTLGVLVFTKGHGVMLSSKLSLQFPCFESIYNNKPIKQFCSGYYIFQFRKNVCFYIQTILVVPNVNTLVFENDLKRSFLLFCQEKITMFQLQKPTNQPTNKQNKTKQNNKTNNSKKTTTATFFLLFCYRLLNVVITSYNRSVTVTKIWIEKLPDCDQRHLSYLSIIRSLTVSYALMNAK